MSSSLCTHVGPYYSALVFTCSFLVFWLLLLNWQSQQPSASLPVHRRQEWRVGGLKRFQSCLLGCVSQDARATNICWIVSYISELGKIPYILVASNRMTVFVVILVFVFLSAFFLFFYSQWVWLIEKKPDRCRIHAEVIRTFHDIC